MHGVMRKGIVSQRCGSLTSFDKILGRQPGSNVRPEGEPPSMHELFAMTMREELTLPQFMQALAQLHNVRVTPAAARLLSSIDASSGRVTFAQFQRALQEDLDTHALTHGMRIHILDQAHAIMEDNLGPPLPPEPRIGAGKHMTDINQDEVVKACQRIGKIQAKGAFSCGLIGNTNEASYGNPFRARTEAAIAEAEVPFQRPDDVLRPEKAEDDYGLRQMGANATRMFVNGDLDKKGFEKFLARCGIVPDRDSDLWRQIICHNEGSGSFTKLSLAVDRELSRAAASGGS